MTEIIEDSEKFVVVKSSEIHGSGIFTSINVPKDSKIMKITGEVISGDECERREEEESNVYIFWNDEDCYIDAINTEKIKYINHDCNYNCEVVENDNETLYLIAYRDINSGEELTIDYGYKDIYDECRCEKCNT